MKEQREWNPYNMNPVLYPGQREFPWLYPYGNQMNYWNLWNSPERMEDEVDTKRLRELYPLMARRLQPYVEEVCTRLEYPGSMMYDEYPDHLSAGVLHRDPGGGRADPDARFRPEPSTGQFSTGQFSRTAERHR